MSEYVASASVADVARGFQRGGVGIVRQATTVGYAGSWNVDVFSGRQDASIRPWLRSFQARVAIWLVIS